MPSWNILTMPDRSGNISFAGIGLRSILSAELFREASGLTWSNMGGSSTVASLCHDRWTDLASTLASLPEEIELFVVTSNAGRQLVSDATEQAITFLAVGRGASEAEAEARCRAASDNLWTTLVTILDYVELAPITEMIELERVVSAIESPFVTEVRRRVECLRVSHGMIARRTIGFDASSTSKNVGSPSEESDERVGRDDGECLFIPHLFPWVPSDDTWRRLLEALAETDGAAALVVHLCNVASAPEACVHVVHDAMAKAEQVHARNVDARVETVLNLQVDVLRHEALRRMAILEGRLLAARVFVTSQQATPAVLMAIVADSLDDASTHPSQSGAEAMFRGGSEFITQEVGEPLSAFDELKLETLFSPREASGILRTPMPVEVQLPGVRINRARTAAMIGRSGEDVPLGFNIHRGQHLAVKLDEAMRFRHTYIVGQTGTGKSTLLSNMILHDIGQNRGVCVLDPHGSLIESVLLHYPKERAEDLVIVDVTDVERPVGFNPLCITEKDGLQYRLARDLVIDDLLSYLNRNYDSDMMGPIFETHVRGMMGLLLGVEPQDEKRVPNLLVLRSLYTNSDLLKRLNQQMRGKDLMLDDFIKEATSATFESSLKNMSSYVTSKFNRFVSDMTLRNITCQNSILDIDDIVNSGKVLLFYLGKGRFGDQSAGLLASQIVSRLRHVVMKRGAGADVRPFFLYADEFQLFADERFAELLAEARKFKLSLTIAHQYVQQLPPAVLQGVLGNVGTTISFRVGAPDGEMLEPIYKPTFNARDITSLSNFRAYVRSFGTLGLMPFSVEMDAPPGDGDEEKAAMLKQLARLKYGRDRRAIEEEIATTFRLYNEPAV